MSLCKQEIIISASNNFDQIDPIWISLFNQLTIQKKNGGDNMFEFRAKMTVVKNTANKETCSL